MTLGVLSQATRKEPPFTVMMEAAGEWLSLSLSTLHKIPLQVQVKTERRQWIQESIQRQGHLGRARP